MAFEHEIPSQEKLLSVPEFAAALRVTVAAVRRWLLERKIASIRVGGRLVRIPASELDRIIEEGYRPAKPREIQLR